MLVARRNVLTLIGLSWLLAGCAGPLPTTATPELLEATARGGRPLAGWCSVTVAARVHDDEGEEGGCGGGEHEEPGEEPGGGGPPIGRHYDLAGTCQMGHLGRTEVRGRLNVTGPLGGGHGGNGQGQGQGGTLAVRGRLLFIAANDDQLAGRYVPVDAAFASAGTGDGGTLRFSATERFGEACQGGGGGAAGEHEEPSSTGRFLDASGEATLLGVIAIQRSTMRGAGQLQILNGRINY